MNKTGLFSGLISALAISSGCLSIQDEIPDRRAVYSIAEDRSWFKKDDSRVYEQNGMLFAIGIGRSALTSLAQQAAEADARQKLAKHLSGKENYEITLKGSEAYRYQRDSNETRCLVGMPDPRK